jgi:hypothetical protein
VRLTPADLKAESESIARLLKTSDGGRLVAWLERRYIRGEPPRGSDRELYEWVGERNLALALLGTVNASEGTGNP